MFIQATFYKDPTMFSVLVVSVCLFSNTFPEFIRGDANLDHKVNISDAIEILRGINDLCQGECLRDCPDSADANDDGGVNLRDAIFLLQYLFSHGPKPYSHFPNQGIDHTFDSLGCRELGE